ncbi:hypothetical protein A1O7_02194 [Cladophialophora yegresii CBS 114405]|uniref:Uncharacterized protein n=1 Tax=Cladophialophora yegresii CBS 114405 TaxID=1182544 RepID=W9WTW3_9EURO|nr:uncharacterized protein A1O7_02194 [Cladophialophora yegresii CBS 114405]EXJ61764.1 hypothetical protein A1O7_02194 [Cladophialophora yegresii CBS 114405]
MNTPSISAALVSGKQETNLAGLATINFDFSLVKVEPPLEYRGLGACLSKDRREVAENGLQHVTARKLGALFRSALPEVVYLVKAYGARVSEIAESPTSNSGSKRDNGAFADFVGADGTSIWAAATSGRDAILAHLLACMLARMWSHQEATSIWHELVEARRKILQTEASDPVALAASQATLTRAQLADWDASARSWLQVADAAKFRSQKQLMLIIQEFGLVVNTKKNLYDSVLDAWAQALGVVNRLVQGIPQNVQSGAILLGLASWHLYPNILALGSSSNQVVEQKDSLLPDGGLLTLGVKSASPTLPEGIFWSLPLAYLRYYGNAVTITKAVSDNHGYGSMKDLALIALGCLFPDRAFEERTFLTVARLVSLLESQFVKLQAVKQEGSTRPCPDWLQFLSQAANELLSARKDDAKTMLKRVSFGSRRCERFLSRSSVSSYPFSVLWQTEIYFQLLGTVELKIEFLRKIASRLVGKGSDQQMIIAYRSSPGDPLSLATAFPIASEAAAKEETNPATREEAQHCRWLGGPPGHLPLMSEQFSVIDTSKALVSCPSALAWVGAPKPFTCNSKLGDEEDYKRYFTSPTRWSQHDGSFLPSAHSEDFMSLFLEVMERYVPLDTVEDDFAIVEELPGIAIFHPFLATLLQQHYIPVDTSQLCSLIDTGEVLDGKQLRSIQCLAIASAIYDQMPGARVNLDVTQHTIHTCRWVGSGRILPYRTWMSSEISRRKAFACITWFETGSIDLSPTDLAQAMALSIGNSLFIAAALLRDPSDDSAQATVTRVNGNIGKAGFAILIPPPDPLSKTVGHESFNVINHAPYDGNFQDSFEHTSMHLSLTDYSIPFATEHKSFRDVEAYFQEAVISVFDRSEWVADLDVLKSLASIKHYRTESKGSKHSSAECGLYNPFDEASTNLTSVDTWAELIDRPLGAAVVRARGNWVGRLAAACLSVQRNHETLVLPSTVSCWTWPAKSNELFDYILSAVQTKKPITFIM